MVADEHYVKWESKRDAVLRDVLSGGPFDGAVTGFVLSCLPDVGAAEADAEIPIPNLFLTLRVIFI